MLTLTCWHHPRNASWSKPLTRSIYSFTMRNCPFNANKPAYRSLFSRVMSLRGAPMPWIALVLWASALNIKMRELCLYCGVMFGLFCEICQSFLIRKLSGEHQEVRHSSAAEKRPGLPTRFPQRLPERPAAECTRGWQPQDSESSWPSTSASDSPARLGAQQAGGLFGYSQDHFRKSKDASVP